MQEQGSKPGTIAKALGKRTLNHPESFQHISISCEDILNVSSIDKLQQFSFTVGLTICIFVSIYKIYMYVCISVYQQCEYMFVRG